MSLLTNTLAHALLMFMGQQRGRIALPQPLYEYKKVKLEVVQIRKRDSLNCRKLSVLCFP